MKAPVYEDIIKALPVIRAKFGKKLSALEYADGLAYQTVTRWVPGKFMEVGEGEHLLFVEVAAEDNEIMELVEKLPQFKESVMANNDK
jgi:hypothetical protein